MSLLNILGLLCNHLQVTSSTKGPDLSCLNTINRLCARAQQTVEKHWRIPGRSSYADGYL